MKINNENKLTVFETLKINYKWICLALTILGICSGFLPWLYTEHNYLSAWTMLKNEGAGKGTYYFELTLIMLVPLISALISLPFKKDSANKFMAIIMLLILLFDVLQSGTYYSTFEIKCTAGAGIVANGMLLTLSIGLAFYLSGCEAKTACCFVATIIVYLVAFSLYGYHDLRYEKMNFVAFSLLAWALISCMTEFLMAFLGIFNEKFNYLVRWNMVVAFITLGIVACGFLWLV